MRWVNRRIDPVSVRWSLEGVRAKLLGCLGSREGRCDLDDARGTLVDDHTEEPRITWLPTDRRAVCEGDTHSEAVSACDLINVVNDEVCRWTGLGP